MTEKHLNTTTEWPQTRAEVELASADVLTDFMSCCHVEPADFDNCLACYAYLVVQNRESQEQDND
jgi:hypothetical protein